MPYPIPLNADHIDFERKHADTKPEDRPDWPLPSFDARDWAKAFCRRFMIMERAGYDTKPVDDDEGLMMTLFANALMRGFDEQKLAAVCREFIKEHKIRAPESCYQMDNVVEAAPDLVEQVCNLVGYWDDDTNSVKREG